MADTRFRAGDEPIPGFVLHQFLGAGNFGEVWEARNVAGGVKVAMKILLDIDRKAGRKAFKALQLVKNLNCPHLVKIYGFWLKDEKGNFLDTVVDPNFSEDSTVSGISAAILDGDAGGARRTMTLDDSLLGPDTVRETPNTADRPAQLFIAMGLAEESLEQCLQRHQAERAAGGRRRTRAESLDGIPRDELMRYFEGAAKGLDFLNIEHRIQHNDVKPANIMIVAKEAQVSDFDLARTLVEDLRTTTTKMGTIAFMAPEVFDTGRPSDCSDQYALAVSYYELRTGKLPYTQEVYSVVIKEKLSGLNLNLLPARERKVVRRATATNPAARYASCGEFVRELRKEPRDWAKLARRTAAALVVLAGLLAAWQWVVPPPWRLSDVAELAAGRLFDVPAAKRPLDTTEEYLALMSSDFWLEFERLEGNADVRVSGTLLLNIRSRIDTISLLAGLYTHDECQPLVAPNARLLNLLCARATEILQSDNLEQAEGQLLKLRAHVEERIPLFVDAVEDRARWRQAVMVALARVRTARGEALEQVEADLRDLPPPGASFWSDHPQRSGYYAIRTLLARQGSGDVLSKTVLSPAAELVKVDSGLAELTAWEKAQIEQLVLDIRREYLSRKDTRVFDSEEIDWLRVVTKIDVDLWNLLVEARNALDGALATRDYREATEKIRAVRRHMEQSSASAQGNEHLLRELELLLVLSDPTALPAAHLDHFVAVVTGRGGYYEQRPELFIEALLERAQATVLESDAADADGFVPVDLTVAASLVQQTLGAGRVLAGGADRYLGWWAGIEAVDAIYRTDPAVDEWRVLCDRFEQLTRDMQPVDESLRALVGLCRSECLIALESNMARPSVSDEVQSRLAQSLTHFGAVLPAARWGPYVRYCDCLRAYLSCTQLDAAGGGNGAVSAAERSLIEAAEQLLQILGEPAGPESPGPSVSLWSSRPLRAAWFRALVLRAILPQRGGASLAVPSDVLVSPFGQTPLADAYRLLSYLREMPSASERSIEDDDRLAQAAYFYAQEIASADPARFDEVIRDAVGAADRAVADFDVDNLAAVRQRPAGEQAQLIRNLLIGARARQSMRQPEELAASFRALARIANCYLDIRIRQGARMSPPQEFYDGVLLPSLEAVRQTPLGSAVQTYEVATRATLQEHPLPIDVLVTGATMALDVPGETSVRKDIAALFAAQGRLLSALEVETAEEEAGERPAGRQAFLAYAVAAALDPDNRQYVVNKALTFREAVQAGVAEEISFLRGILQRMERLDAVDQSDVEGLPALRGRLYLLEARSQTAEDERRRLLEDAILEYDKALGRIPAGGSQPRSLESFVQGEAPADAAALSERERQNRADFLIGGATSRVELANFLQPIEEIDRIRTLLADAAEYARLASTLVRDEAFRVLVNIAWGNALEDQAMLLGETDKYDSAIAKFEDAIAVLRDNFATDSPNLYRAYLGKGRAMYRQAAIMDAEGLPRLQLALETLAEGIHPAFTDAETLAEIKYYQAGAYLWLARAKMRDPQQRQLPEWREDLARAERTYEQAVNLVREQNLATLYWPEWQLEWAQALVFLILVNDVAGGETYRDRLFSITRELAEPVVDGGGLDTDAAQASLSRRRARVAIEAVGRLRLLLDQARLSSVLNAPEHVSGLEREIRAQEERLIERIAQPDLCAFSALVSAQQVKSGMSVANQKELRESTVKRLADAAKAVRTRWPDDPEAQAWATRLDAEQALILRAAFLVIPKTGAFDDWQSVGRDICRRLLSVVQSPPGQHGPAPDELHYLRAMLVDVTIALLGHAEFNKKVPLRDRENLWNAADQELRALDAARESWLERAKRMTRVERPDVAFWYWGTDESKLLIEGGVPSDLGVRLSRLRRNLDAVKPK